MAGKRKQKTVTFHPPFRASGNFVLDSLGMVLAQFMPVEQILVGGKVHAIADFVVTALNEFAEKPGTYFTPKAVLDVVANDMAGRLPDVVIANPPMGTVKKAKKFSRVSKGVRKIAKLKAEKNPGGGGLWRLRK